MTAPKHARDLKGKGRYYGACSDSCPLGDDLYISVTNAQGVVNKPTLVPSAVKITAEKALDMLPQLMAASRVKPCQPKRVADECGRCGECLVKQLKREHKNIWEHAADTGTRVHAHAEAHVLGSALPYDPEVEPFLNQYLFFLDRFGVDLDKHVEAAETTVFDREHGYAGTGDLWVHLPISPNGNPSKRRYLWLVDLKTSLKKPANTVYADQVLQLAGLRFAKQAVLPDDSVVDLPKFAGTALLNLRQSSHALIPLPADEAAHAAFVHAVGLQRFMHGANDAVKEWAPVELPSASEKREVA